METRKLAALLVTILNEAAEKIDAAMSGDSDDDANDKPAKGDKKKNRGDDVPSEDDIVTAARGALKILERDDVKRIIKKHGKAEKAAEVEPEKRQAVIDALEEAVKAKDEEDDD